MKLHNSTVIFEDTISNVLYVNGKPEAIIFPDSGDVFFHGSPMGAVNHIIRQWCKRSGMTYQLDNYGWFDKKLKERLAE